MPVLLGILSIIVGLGVAALFAREFTLSIFIVNMMTAMGLALGIDYSLFVISRFREERARGLDKEAAIRRVGATASRAVLFSGSTFVVALLGLFLVRTNVLRSLAAGAVIVGAVSVVAALTLLPAVLSLIGDRVNSLRLPIVGRNLGGCQPSGSRDLEILHRAGAPPPRHQPRARGRRHAARSRTGARPAHRPERRLHAPEQPPLQAGLRRGAALLPEPEPLPGRDRRRRGKRRGSGRSHQAAGDARQTTRRSDPARSRRPRTESSWR